jgi:hypothetical protein
VHAAAAVFDHDEDVEAAQEDGVDVGEIGLFASNLGRGLGCRHAGAGQVS